MKCRELVEALRREVRQNHSVLSEKLADLGAIHEETQRRLEVLEMMYHQSNYGNVEGEEEEEQEGKDEPKASISSVFNASRYTAALKVIQVFDLSSVIISVKGTF